MLQLALQPFRAEIARRAPELQSISSDFEYPRLCERVQTGCKSLLLFLDLWRLTTWNSSGGLPSASGDSGDAPAPAPPAPDPDPAPTPAALGDERALPLVGVPEADTDAEAEASSKSLSSCAPS